LSDRRHVYGLTRAGIARAGWIVDWAAKPAPPPGWSVVFNHDQVVVYRRVIK
jgi:hypothetical protein